MLAGACHNVLFCHHWFMRITIEIPDATFRELKMFTAECGISMKEFVVRAVQERLARVRRERRHRRGVKLPLIPKILTGTIPPKTNADVELLD